MKKHLSLILLLLFVFACGQKQQKTIDFLNLKEIEMEEDLIENILVKFHQISIENPAQNKYLLDSLLSITSSLHNISKIVDKVNEDKDDRRKINMRKEELYDSISLYENRLNKIIQLFELDIKNVDFEQNKYKKGKFKLSVVNLLFYKISVKTLMVAQAMEQKYFDNSLYKQKVKILIYPKEKRVKKGDVIEISLKTAIVFDYLSKLGLVVGNDTIPERTNFTYYFKPKKIGESMLEAQTFRTFPSGVIGYDSILIEYNVYK